MQEYPNLTPDAETFARVWKRVMPDESMSRIVVHPPEGKQDEPEPFQTPRRAGDEELLRQMLEVLDEGVAGVEEIARRQPGAWPLRENLNRSAAQLRAAWLLLTGRRWSRSRAGQGKRVTMPQLLRDQYLWELRFSRLCRETGEIMEREDIREIFPEQEGGSMGRRRMLRHLLAQT